VVVLNQLKKFKRFPALAKRLFRKKKVKSVFKLKKIIFSLILVAVIFSRFIFELKLSSKFNINESIKLNFCLKSQPYCIKDSQSFYYQNHFQRLKIQTNLDKKYDFGDCLEITGKIVACQPSSNVKYCLLNPAISTYQPPLTFFVLKKMRQLRQSSAEFFYKNLPYPYSDLLAGIVLGIKQNLDPQLFDQLRQTGTLHIIVASGYNLTVSSQRPAQYLAYLIGREPAVFGGLLLIWLYICLVGCQPPVVRAGILLTIIFLARLSGRKFAQWRGLGLAVWLMLVFKPDLILDISFQLSFAAMLGIIFGSRVFKRVREIPLVGDGIAESLSAQILVAPIIGYHFGRLSILAPVTNGLILFVIPYLTWGGISALLTSFLPPLGVFILLILYPILWWVIKVVRWFSRFSLAEIGFQLPWWGVILSYLIIFLVFHIKLTAGKTKSSSQIQPQLFT